MTVLPLYRLDESFYVPEFAVTVSGAELPHHVVKDVSQVTFKDAIGEIDSFDLVVTNWDATERKFKYVPATDKRLAKIFDPGAELELSLGYRGNVRQLLRGEITTLEPTYPESGVPTLSVRGLNVLHRLRTQQHTEAWERKRDSDIALELGRRGESRTRAGLPIQVRTDPLPQEPEEPYVFMDNQFDIVFLLNRAQRHGYEVVLRKEPSQGGTTTEVLYFGPSESRKLPDTYKLEWGKSLATFRPTLTTARQISQVEVRGWDRRTNRPIVFTAKWQDDPSVRAPAERRRMERLAEAFGNRSEVITDQPVHSRADACRIARSRLRSQLRSMVSATGSTVGLPELRAGRKVEISGFGDLFDGTYLLTKTTHTVRPDAGYTTEFECRREGPPSGEGASG